MGTELVPLGEQREYRRRSEDGDLWALFQQHITEDRHNFQEILKEIQETKSLIGEVKASVSGAVTLFNHSKWFVKVLIGVGGVITFGVTIWYMIVAIKNGQPPT